MANGENDDIADDGVSSIIYSDSAPDSPEVSKDETAGHKRIRDEEEGDLVDDTVLKRPKFQSEASHASSALGLSRDIWVEICHFLTPFTLAQLMRVDRTFFGLLSDNEVEIQLRANDFWASSRLSSYPSLPDSLNDCTELDMLKLIFGNRCSSCGYTQARSFSHQRDITAERKLHLVWSFSVRLCDICLVDHTKEEASLFFSTTSFLIPILPFAFLGDARTIIPSISLQHPGTITNNKEIKKVYYKPMIEKLKLLFETEQLCNSNKAQFDMLRAKNLAKRHQVEDWECWEASGGLRRLRSFDLSADAGDRLPPATYMMRRSSSNNLAVIPVPKSNIEFDVHASQHDVQERLGIYADEVIQNTWAEGQGVTADNAPNFAADVLLYVRRRFFSTLLLESQRAAAEQAQQKPKSLVLNDMKWVFDHKIKPLTEPLRKDLFLCNGCASSTNRYYGFEAVIQHFASKHTDNFRVGNTVVHWQLAEWPEDPPFVPDPGNRRLNPLSHTGAQFPNQASHSSALTQHRPFPVPLASASGMRLVAQHSPGPYADHSFQGTPLDSQYGPFAPPGLATFGLTTSPFNGQLPFVRPGSFTPLSSQGWPVPSYRPIYSPSLASPGSHALVPAPPLMADAASLRGPISQLGPSTGPNLYNSQRDELAKIARDIWNATSGIKDIPPSVRVYVVIFHVVSQFRVSFSNEPNLDLFEDCVLHHPNLIPLKNASGLACKACVLNDEAGDEDGPSHSVSFRMGGRKLYPFHSLLQHFKSVHIEQPMSSEATADEDSERPSRLGWKEDMIELPDSDLIEKLPTANGMTPDKLRIIAAAFPESLPGIASQDVEMVHNDSEYDPRNPALATDGPPHARSSRSVHSRTNDASSVSERSRSRPRSLVTGGVAARPESGSLSQHGSVSSFAPPPHPPADTSSPNDRIQAVQRGGPAFVSGQDTERDPPAFYVKTEPTDDGHPSEYQQPIYMFAPRGRPDTYSRNVHPYEYDGRAVSWNASSDERRHAVYDSRDAAMNSEYVFVRMPNPNVRREGILDGQHVEFVRLVRPGDERDAASWQGERIYHDRNEFPMTEEQLHSRRYSGNRGQGRF